MPDNRGKQKLDRTLISLKQTHEVRYWCKALGVTPERLREASKSAGPSARDVRDYLRDDKWASGEVAGLA